MYAVKKTGPGYRIICHNGRQLGRVAPPLAGMRRITAADFATYLFSEFVLYDVWTADGWLVHSSFGPDGLECGLRKGTTTAFACFDPETPLYVNYAK